MSGPTIRQQLGRWLRVWIGGRSDWLRAKSGAWGRDEAILPEHQLGPDDAPTSLTINEQIALALQAGRRVHIERHYVGGVKPEAKC